MGIESQIGINSVILIVFFVVIGIYNQSIVEDGIIFQILINIPIALIVGFLVWFLTTRNDRKNRNYTRGRIVTVYLQCVAISGALVSVPLNRTNIVELTNTVLANYNLIINRVRAQAHLLNPHELDNFIAEQDTVRDFFIPDLLDDPNNMASLQNFHDFFRTLLSNYVVDHKLREFNEYVLDQ